MINLIKKYWYSVIIIGAVYAACHLLLCYCEFDIGKINDGEFMFTYLGVLLGFAITLFTFIISLVDKVIENQNSDTTMDLDKKDSKNKSAKDMLSEMKQNIYFIFFCFLIISIAAFLNRISIPYIEQEVKLTIIKSLKLSIFLLSLYAIYDMISTTFKLVEPASFKK